LSVQLHLLRHNLTRKYNNDFNAIQLNNIGWPRVERSLDVSHVYEERPRADFILAFLGTFLITSKSSIKTNFFQENIEFLKLKNLKLLIIEIFKYFFILKKFKSI
jgi:hypothetical protein